MKIVDRIIQRAQRTPYFHLPGYMNRWWLVPYIGAGSATDIGCGPVSWRRPIAKMLQFFGIAVRVHEILRSDAGRHPHDHPWWFVTIILRGGYIETVYNEQGKLRDVNYWGPGTILFRRASSWHRLTLPEQDSTWTLFITGPKSQTWGFNVKGKKISHREYGL